MLVVAAGSGISQAVSCASHRRNKMRTEILWCIEQDTDQLALRQAVSADTARWEIHVDPTATVDNRGLQWLARHAHRYIETQIIIAGAPGFVYTVTDMLTGLGCALENLQSDVYDYAPRG